MKLKNKIIKWLGGYTLQEILSNRTITCTKTEKDVIPIKVGQIVLKEHIEFAKKELANKFADFIFNHNLCLFNVINNQDDTYTVEALIWVKEP